MNMECLSPSHSLDCLHSSHSNPSTKTSIWIEACTNHCFQLRQNLQNDRDVFGKRQPDLSTFIDLEMTDDEELNGDPNKRRREE